MVPIQHNELVKLYQMKMIKTIALEMISALKSSVFARLVTWEYNSPSK